jgi:hypothetical protein
MRPTSGPERVERAIVALAELQSGVVSRAQLRGLGLSDRAISRRIEMGWLIPILYGVYAVGHRPRLLRGWHNAALLAAGGRSALSNASAGAHWKMTNAPSKPHVIAPRSADGITGIVVHRPRALAEGDIIENEGLRVTSPARTLLDLAGEGASKRALERALDQAEIHHLHYRSTSCCPAAGAGAERQHCGPSSNGTARPRPSPRARRKKRSWQS